MAAGRPIKRPNLANHTSVVVVTQDVVDDVLRSRFAADAIGQTLSLGG